MEGNKSQKQTQRIHADVKEPLARKVWEVRHYYLISVSLTKSSLHMTLHDGFFLFPRSKSIQIQILH